MIAKLDRELRREVTIGKRKYALLLSPDGLKLTEKGKRLGTALTWRDITSGDAALAAALQASTAKKEKS